MIFEQLFKKEIQLAKMLGIESVNVAYTIKGLLQLRACNYRLRARKAPKKRFCDMVAYSDMIMGIQCGNALMIKILSEPLFMPESKML
jgi:hypothetical protein